MATSIIFNGTTYSVPSSGETSWSSLSDYLLALGTFAATTSTQKSSIRSPTGAAVTVSATTDCTIVCKPSPLSAVTVTLPVGITGQTFNVVDGVNTAQTNNITVQGSSGQLIDGAATYVINLNNGAATFQFDTVGWRVTSDSIGTSPLPDSKLATIATAGKVSNSATTANSANSNSTIVARDGGGSVAVQNLNAVQVITTGAASLGNSSSALHTLQGAQASDYQLKVNNLQATNGSGLQITTANGTSAVNIQDWSSGGTTKGSVNGAGKWTIGTTSGSQSHELRCASTYLIRPNDTVGNASLFGFTNAAGALQAYVALGANTGAGLVAGEYNNGLILKSAAGLVFSGTNNRVDGGMDSAGAFTFGASGVSSIHAINGGTSYGTIATPATPATGYLSLYAKADKRFYIKNDAGLESLLSVGNGITALTGDVVAAGPGSVAATIQAGVVTNAMLAGSIADSKLLTISTAGKVLNSATSATNSVGANTIISRDAAGSFQAFAAALDSITTTSAVTLGNSVSTLHTLQGAQSGDYQVKVNNLLNSAGVGGLSVNTVNISASTLVQGWSANGVNVGSVNGVGAFTLGNTATSSFHTLQGTTAADYQVKITNNSSGTTSAGLYVNTVNTNANGGIQGWHSNGTRVGIVDCAGAWNIGPTTPGTTFAGNRIRGVTNASGGIPGNAGDVGEVLEARQPTNTNFPATATYGDGASISLTPGCWMITALLHASNGATTNGIYVGISTTTGNSATGLVAGDTFMGGTGPTNIANNSVTVPNYVVNISATAIHYLKVYAEYTTTAPQYRCRLTAIRIR